MIKFWERGCVKNTKKLEKSFENLNNNLKSSFAYFNRNLHRFNREELESEIDYYSYLSNQLRDMESEYCSYFVFGKNSNFFCERARDRCMTLFQLLDRESCFKRSYA